jgi:hypothetical protein
MRKLVVPSLIAALIGVVLLVVPAVGSADPDLSNVGAHRHYLVTGSGASLVYLAEVGPDLCDDAGLQNAFNQYHNNAHSASASAIGPAAPGLHNGKGAEIVSRGCSFVPPS